MSLNLDFGLIRSIHSLLRQQTDLKYRLDQIPRRLQLAKTNEAQFLASWEAAKAEYRRLHLSIDEKQLQLDEREARIGQMKVRMNTCDSNKEFQLIKECIAADTQANSVLQDEIFELLERLDAQKLVCESGKRNFEKSQTEKDQLSQALIAEQKQLEAELTEASQRLKDEEVKLKGDVLQEYRHSLRGLGENIFGESDGQACGNCFQNLTIQKSADLRMNRPVYCQGCGCLLYLTAKQSSAAED
jgi:predicted  nucleic acid-binding Zn-ribbon protein